MKPEGAGPVEAGPGGGGAPGCPRCCCPEGPCGSTQLPSGHPQRCPRPGARRKRWGPEQHPSEEGAKPDGPARGPSSRPRCPLSGHGRAQEPPGSPSCTGRHRFRRWVGTRGGLSGERAVPAAPQRPLCAEPRFPHQRVLAHDMACKPGADVKRKTRTAFRKLLPVVSIQSVTQYRNSGLLVTQ